MGVCASSDRYTRGPPTAGDDRDRKLDQQLVEQQIQSLFQFKILLLGAGESGKSTIVKQLQLIHKRKPGPAELELVTTSLHQNVIECMQSLVRATEMKSLDIAGFTDPEDVLMAQRLTHYEDGVRITPEFAEQILRFHKTEQIQAAWDNRDKFWILDAFPYYIENLMRFVQPDFVPSEDDQIMARIRTTGIIKTDLEQKIAQDDPNEQKSITFEVVDVGGQRNERKKWIHCFDNVNGILFVVNLAGYKQVLFEDSTKNRMVESLELFEKVTRNPLFENTPIFLFLNKKDLFETMVQASDMKLAGWEDYDGGKDLKNALAYVQRKFEEKLPAKKTAETEIVSARVKMDVRSAFGSVKKALYDSSRVSILKEVARLKKELANLEQGGAVKWTQSNGGCC